MTQRLGTVFIAVSFAVGVVALTVQAGPASGVISPIAPPTPAPSAAARAPRTVPPPMPNHVLKREACGVARGRAAWWNGAVECHVMDDGAVVAIHPGAAKVTYTGTPTQKEIDYVDANWYTLGARGYDYLPNEDCANFVSESLHARGWSTSTKWHPDSIDWVSSTHLRAWILAHHPDVTELKGVAAFPEVKVGDIAQFDWHNKGIRNHTAIVTRVEHLADGTWQVWVGEHTDPYQYRNVLHVVTKVHPGATVYFLSLPS